MNSIELKERQDISANFKVAKAYKQLKDLLAELKKKEIPDPIIQAINRDVEELNSTDLLDNELAKLVKQKQSKIVKLLEKELKIVPQKYYTKLWLVLGMSVFGIPLGVAFGTSIGNLGLISTGLPMGMGIGAMVGAGMDKKALQEGRQLALEIN